MAVKERFGLVVSDKMDKTVVVAVENRAPHPKYRKIVVQTKRYKVHDEENRCQVGDRVRIRETRPLSRTKRWIVVDIVGHSLAEPVKRAADTQPEEQPRDESPEVSVSETNETHSETNEAQAAVSPSEQAEPPESENQTEADD